MKHRSQTGASAVLLALLVVTTAASQMYPPQPPQGQQPQAQPPGQQPAGPPQPSQEEVAAIQKIVQTRDPQQRLALVDDFLAKFPESLLRSRAYAAAAEAYQAQSNFAKAVEYGEKALELAPRDAFSMLLVAESLAASGVPTQPDFQDKLTKAEGYVRRALEILPELFASMPHRPEVPAEQYKLEEQYVESQAHGILGFVYLRRAQYAQAEQQTKLATQAEEELKLATQMNQKRPYDVDFWRLGTAHKLQKEYPEAEAAFQRCVELAGSAGDRCQRELDTVRRVQKAQQPAEEKKP